MEFGSVIRAFIHHSMVLNKYQFFYFNSRNNRYLPCDIFKAVVTLFSMTTCQRRLVRMSLGKDLKALVGGRKHFDVLSP